MLRSAGSAAADSASPLWGVSLYDRRMNEIADDVELLDCGDGRRLERYGALVLDRPAPAVAGVAPLDPGAWRRADARYDRGAGWEGRRATAEPWEVRFEGLALECRLTETGGVGLFPEHRPVIGWIVRRAEAQPGLRLLNLFAHTGALTLAAARAGAKVTHLDGSRTAVAWARGNAARTGLGESPVRWLVDDAEGFVARELRRGRRYDGIALDPPSYGHGPGRERWRLEERLVDLLRSCAALLEPAGRTFLVVTAHTPGWDGARLGTTLLEAIGPEARKRGDLETGALSLTAASGAILPAGASARWRARR